MNQHKTTAQHVLTPESVGNSKPYKVYVLYCPLDRIIKYVGFCTGSPLRRYRNHISEAAALGYMDKHKWIAALKEQGKRPFMRVLACFDTKDDALLHEACLVRYIYDKRPLFNRAWGMIDSFRLATIYPQWLDRHRLAS